MDVLRGEAKERGRKDSICKLRREALEESKPGNSWSQIPKLQNHDKNGFLLFKIPGLYHFTMTNPDNKYMNCKKTPTSPLYIQMYT